MSVKTQNHLFYILTGIIALVSSMPPEVSTVLSAIVPAKYKPYVAAAVALAVWMKGHLNLIAQPPAQEPPDK